MARYRKASITGVTQTLHMLSLTFQGQPITYYDADDDKVMLLPGFQGKTVDLQLETDEDISAKRYTQATTVTLSLLDPAGASDLDIVFAKVDWVDVSFQTSASDTEVGRWKATLKCEIPTA